MELMSLDVKPGEVRCSAKDFFKTYASIYLVTVCGDGLKSTRSCCGYYQSMVCKHGALVDMIGNISFEIPARYDEKCADFRRRVWRENGGQKQDDVSKQTTGIKMDGMLICGEMERSDESKTMSSCILTNFRK